MLRVASPPLWQKHITALRRCSSELRPVGAESGTKQQMLPIRDQHLPLVTAAVSNNRQRRFYDVIIHITCKHEDIVSLCVRGHCRGHTHTTAMLA